MITTDDLPSVGVSRMRAAGLITPAARTTIVQFGDVSFVVAVSHLHFPNGGSWSFFHCPCGRRCRTLRLLEGEIVCRGCCERRGIRPLACSLSRRRRAELQIPRLKAKLESPSLRLKPHLWGTMERRSRHEARLREAEFRVAQRGRRCKAEAIPDPCNEPDFQPPKRR
jgi:hypothetical protein